MLYAMNLVVVVVFFMFQSCYSLLTSTRELVTLDIKIINNNLNL